MASHIEILTDRLVALEQEVASIRKILFRLPSNTFEPVNDLPHFQANKSDLRHAMNAFLETHNIQGKPVEAELLQRHIAAGFKDEELSRDLINARENSP